MGATLSEQWDSKSEEDEELHSGQDELPEDTEDKLLWRNEQISSQNGITESQADEMNSLSDERDFIDVGSGFVTLNEDASDMSDSIREGDVSNNSSKKNNNTDEDITKEEIGADNKVNDTQIGFKKIFSFGGFKFTLKKDKVEKIGEDEPGDTRQDRYAAGPSEDIRDNAGVDEKESKNEKMGGNASVGHPSTHTNMTVERLMQDESPKPKELVSPIKQFFSQEILSSLKKKRKENERQQESKEELESLVEKESTKEDNTCSCLDVSKGKLDKDKDLHLYKKDESKPAYEGDIIHDKAQASPFKRLFKKVSTKRQSEPKLGDTNSPEPENIIGDNSQLSTELIKLQKEHEKVVVETQPGNEMMDRSQEDSKKKSDSAVSWENLLCVRSVRTRSRRTSDSEAETQAKEGVQSGTNYSPFESSTEGDHLTSSNEQGESPAEDDSGSTWKSFKKLVTPKKRSKVEEIGSLEQMHLNTEITKDESSCSLRKLISGRKKIKYDGQQECISFDEGSKGTDIEDDETPGVVPLSDYELAEPKILKSSADREGEIKKEDEMKPIITEDKPKQIQHLSNVQPLRFNAWPSSLPVPTEYVEDLTEFLSKHQQLSDIPEEGMEESIATPQSFVEWTTQYDTLDDDIVDMTADAVTAPEHPSEHNEDETSEMVSAVSHLSESPKTSGNVTPVTPVHHIVSDIIFQEVLESSSMDPSVLSNTESTAQTVSVSQFIVESTTATKTKLLLNHTKKKAASICIGFLCNKIRDEAVHPLPSFEEISEINYVLPTTFVSEDFAEMCETAEMARDNVYEAENKIMINKVRKAILAETAKKSEQQLIKFENVLDVSPVVQIKKEPAFKELNKNTQIHFETEKEQIIKNVKLLATEQLQATKVGDPVGHQSVACKLDPALNHASEITEDRDRVVESDVFRPLLDPIRIKPDFKNEAQMKIEPSTQIDESYTIQGKVKTTELEREAKNAERVFNTIIGTAKAFKNIKMAEEVENSEQNIEPASADTTEITSHEKNVYIFKAENLSEIKDKSTEESEQSTFVRKNIILVTTTNEENAVKEPEVLSGAFLGLEKEHRKTDTVLLEDCEEKLAAGIKSGMLTTNPTETGEDTKKPPAIHKQARVGKEAEVGIQRPAKDSIQCTFSKMITEMQIISEALGSEENDSVKTEIVHGSYVNVELDKCLVNEQEHAGTACTEINTELKTFLFSEVEPQLGPVELQTEATKSSHKPYKENNLANETAFQVTITSLTETMLCKEETQVKCMNQVPNIAEINKISLSVLSEEDTQVENKIFDQTEQSIDEEQVKTMKHITKAMPNNKAETPDSILISQTGWSAHIKEAIKDSNKISLEKIVGSEKNVVPPDKTKQEKVSKRDTAKACGSVVMPIQKDKDVDLSVLSSTVSQVQLKAEAQRPTVIEVEMPFTGTELKETHCNAQTAANIEVKHLTLTDV